MAAGVVITIGGAAIWSAWPATRPPRLDVPAEVTALSGWRSPTESLLETPTSRFLKVTQNIDSAFDASHLPTLASTSQGERQ